MMLTKEFKLEISIIRNADAMIKKEKLKIFMKTIVWQGLAEVIWDLGLSLEELKDDFQCVVIRELIRVMDDGEGEVVVE